MSSKYRSSKSLGQKIRTILIKRSNKALAQAQKEILSEKIQSSEAQAALKYYVANWKEAIHPGLMNFVSEAVGGDSDKVLDLQVSMLLFSAAIDVHDDIIDNSVQKYGRFTVFGKFGRDITILLGNGFMIKGFMSLCKAAEKVSPEVKKEIFKAVHCALFEVGDAHALELRLKSRWDANPDEYLKVLEKKGAIIEAEARIAALVGGGSKREIEALSHYGRILGLLGTLREEFVDIFEIQEITNRVKNECLPIPILYALQDKNAQEKIQAIFFKKKIEEKDLWKALDIIFKTRGVKKLKIKMSGAIRGAVDELSILKETKAKVFLKTLVTSMLENL